MACGACARRRKAMEAKRREKEAAGKRLQAVALSAALNVTAAAGRAIGINGEDEDGRDSEGADRDSEGD